MEKDTAQFVGASRLSVADRIVECHINELIGEDEWANVITKTTVVGEDTDADDLETDEREITYEHIQQFMFEGAPFKSFISAFKLLISRESDTSTKVTAGIRQSLNHLAL